MLQLPESEELRSHRRPEGVATKEAAPFTDSAQPTAGQYVTPMPEGETPMYSEAQPESMSEAVHGPESAESGKFMTPPESPESLTQDPPLDTGVPFHTDSAPQQYVNPTSESAQHGTPEFEQVAAPTEAVSQHLTKPLGDSGSYGAGSESGQGVQNQPQMLPAGGGQQQRETGHFGSGRDEGQGSMPSSGLKADADTFSHHKVLCLLCLLLMFVAEFCLAFGSLLGIRCILLLSAIIAKVKARHTKSFATYCV